jgi:hypothetical protein
MPEISSQHDESPKIAYPAPPSVHWAVVLVVQLMVVIAAIGMVPKAYWALIASLVADLWVVYLCVWIRRLNPAFMSLFWCVAFVALELAFTVPGAPLTVSKDITIVATGLIMLDVLLWITTIYVLRAELHFHYNQREPVGLYLGGAMTFFFSYSYFQYHLRRIARLKSDKGYQNASKRR